MMMERLLRRREVEELVGFKHAWLYKLISEGKFPRPIRVGKRATRWRESDVARWIQEQIDQSASAKAS
jgi:prophage regulatory protein